MKTIILIIGSLLISLVSGATTLTFTDKINLADKFDPIFRLALLQIKIIADTSFISQSDVERVENMELRTYLWVEDKEKRIKPKEYKITSLKGLEYFISLRRFKLTGSWADTLEYIPSFSRFKELRELELEKVRIPSLDVTGCKNLISLNCSGCGLDVLNLRKNTKLRNLDCTYNNLVELDISRNKQLQTVIVNSQRSRGLISEGGRAGMLSKLIFPDNRSAKEGIRRIECADNNLENLDVSRLPYLLKLDCGWNKLKALNTSNNKDLKELDCEANYINELDFTANQKMESLTCGLQGYAWIRNTGKDYRLLKKLTLPIQKGNAEECYLRKLSIREISPEAIPVFRKYPYLQELNCAENLLELIDLNANTSLEVLDCSDNPISQLNLQANINLHSLGIRSCSLQELDLSQTKVKRIKCDSYDRRKELVEANKLRNCGLKLTLPKGYHAETIDFATGTMGSASFLSSSILINLPPQYIQLIESRR